jgi:transcriptional regulator with XRE-family HTH domain
MRTGTKIRERRNQLEISQTKFGREALKFKGSDNAIQKLISKIETGKRKITIIELYAISKYLKKPMEYFISEETGTNLLIFPPF